MSRKISSKELKSIVFETRDKSMAKSITNGELRNMIIEAMNDMGGDLPQEVPGHDAAPIPKGVITKVQGAEPDSDGDGMGPDGGRKLGNGGKSRMARQHLYKIAEYGVELWNLLDDEDEIPEWCQSKIAIISDSIGKVKHHLEYKIEKPKIEELELDND